MSKRSPAAIRWAPSLATLWAVALFFALMSPPASVHDADGRAVQHLVDTGEGA